MSKDEQKLPQKKEIVISDFPIVGIGASAGGLGAFESFFRHTPSDIGAAFVLVPHLDPTHKSMMSSLLRNYTSMSVYEIEDGMVTEKNCVYVIPPGKDLAIYHGSFQLLEPTKPRGYRAHINFFLRSLAEDQKSNAVGIILSGTGSDGTEGIKEIKLHGGTTIVQTVELAKYDGMPRSAVSTGMVDYILPVEKMPERIRRIARMSKTKVVEADEEQEKDVDEFTKIFFLLRSHTGHDFSDYKRPTILRRIDRRMAVNHIPDLSSYLNHLQRHPAELDALFNDLLIGVTSFFRDKEAFKTLEEVVIPRIFLNKEPDQPIRVWVPGCSTGQEAYSIAMLLLERMEMLGETYRIQVFATDIDAEALETARIGVYPETIENELTSKRLSRFFRFEDGVYRVHKHVRDSVVFSVQNLIKDPPFSKQDLISFRNVLIYLQNSLQKKIIPLFHYALVPNGYLMLGSSETVGTFSDLFAPVDEKWKIYQRQESMRQRLIQIPLVPADKYVRPKVNPVPTGGTQSSVTVADMAEQMLFKHYTPPSVLVNGDYEVMHYYGRTGKYLEIPSGKPTRSVLEMAKKGLRLELRAAIHLAQRENRSVQRENIRIEVNGKAQLIDLSVHPLIQPDAPRGLTLVVFEDIDAPLTSDEAHDLEQDLPEDADPVALQLEQELKTTRGRLQTTIEELENANEELKSSNEELLSMNEELQSTTEELSTSREELQSVNEELMTVNAELQSKVEELTRLNGDLNNFLISTEIGSIFLDLQFRIRRFTPNVTKIFSLINSDTGRPLSDISHQILEADLLGYAERVLDRLERQEVEVQSKSGDWYTMRVVPYRTIDNRIDGVVMTFMEISRLKNAESALLGSDLRFQIALQQMPVVVSSQDLSLRYTWVFNAQHTLPGFMAENALGKHDADIFSQHDARQLTKIKRAVLQSETPTRAAITVTYHGQLVYFEMAVEPYYDQENVLSGVTCALYDVSQYQQMAQSEQLETLFLNKIVDRPIVLLKQNKNLIYTWVHSIGAKEESSWFVDALGCGDVDLFPQEEAEALTALKREVLQSKQGLRTALSLTLNDVARDYDLLIEPLVDEEDVIGISCALAKLSANNVS